MDYKDASVMRTEWDGKSVSVELSIGTENQKVTGSRRPHEDLMDALASCTDIFADHMEIPVSLRDRLHMTAVQYRETSDSSGYVLTAILFCPGTKAEVKMKSSFLAIPKSDGFFSDMDAWGDEVHDPEDYLFLLQDEEISALDRVLLEGYLYAKEGKHAPDPQPDLFDGEPAAEAEAELLDAASPLQLDSTKPALEDRRGHGEE